MDWRDGIRARRDGGYGVRLGARERKLLRSLSNELREAIEASGGDVDGLFKPAFRSDERAEADFVELTRSGVVSDKLEALRTLGETAGAELLSEGDADAWCVALNDLRLVLADRLGVTGDLLLHDVDPGDPNAPAYALYAWLTWLQGELIEALSSRLGAG